MCEESSVEARKRLVQQTVRESILEIDGREDIHVTQDTSLGPSGLGHSCPLRMTWMSEIKKRLRTHGCKVVGVTPTDACKPTIVRVRDVTKLVLANLACSV
jgi:hypothetical protein